jgi:hypothetical protein
MPRSRALAGFTLRAAYRETNYDRARHQKIRETIDADTADGFDPTMCQPHAV